MPKKQKKTLNKFKYRQKEGATVPPLLSLKRDICKLCNLQKRIKFNCAFFNIKEPPQSAIKPGKGQNYSPSRRLRILKRLAFK